MRQQEYNGWTNYESWLVALWLGNEPWSYNGILELTENIQRENEESDWIGGLAAAIEEFCEQNYFYHIDNSGLASDLLRSALSEVNFEEIAKHYLDDYPLEPEEEDEDEIKERLEYLRGELQAERISYEELQELQSLASHIDPDDVELLEAAGVDERSADAITTQVMVGLADLKAKLDK